MGIRIDGKQIQKNITEKLKQTIVDQGLKLSLCVVSVSQDPRSLQYMNIKKNIGVSLGVHVDIVSCDLETTEEIVSFIQDIQYNYDGVLVQLPFSSPSVHVETVLSAIDSSRDVDFLNPNTPWDFTKDFGPPVALAVKRILQECGVDILHSSEHTFAVLGNGRLVGVPCQEMLKQTNQKYNGIDEQTSLEDKKKFMKNAYVIISGTGISGIVTPEHISEQVILIDAGTSLPYSKFAGDIDTACYEKASMYTPVPGGVGPVAVAMLFQNLVTCALMKQTSKE